MAENKLADNVSKFCCECVKANIISSDNLKNIVHDCGAIRRMLISSINTTKTNLE